MVLRILVRLPVRSFGLTFKSDPLLDSGLRQKRPRVAHMRGRR